MTLDFLKGKYTLQLVTFLIVAFLCYLIFQLISITLISSLTSIELNDFYSSDYISKIMENKNGYWILFTLFLFQSVGLFIVPSLIYAKLKKGNAIDYLMIKPKFPFFYFVLVPFLMLAGIFVVGFLGELNMKLDLPSWFKETEEQVEKTIKYLLSFEDTLYIISTTFLVAVIPAIGEELFFRGVIQKIIIKWTKKNWIGILITAFVFSAMHFQFLTFLPRFFMGIVLGYIFVWSRNILIPIFAHFLHNFISIMIEYFSQDSTDKTGASNYYIVVFSVLIMAFTGYYIYRYSNKKYVS